MIRCYSLQKPIFEAYYWKRRFSNQTLDEEKLYSTLLGQHNRRISIKTTEGKGRGIFASSRIATNEIIFEEISNLDLQFLYSFLIIIELICFCFKQASLKLCKEFLPRGFKVTLFQKVMCDNCWKPLDQISEENKCKKCEVAYCSTVCKSNAWLNHHV